MSGSTVADGLLRAVSVNAPGIGDGELRVLISLAASVAAGHVVDWICRATSRELATSTGMRRRSVQHALDALAGRQFISPIDGHAYLGQRFYLTCFAGGVVGTPPATVEVASFERQGGVVGTPPATVEVASFERQGGVVGTPPATVEVASFERQGGVVGTPPHIEERARAARADFDSDFDSGFKSLTVGDSHERSESATLHRKAINMELELASGEKLRSQTPCDQILEANELFRLPFEAIARFLHWKAGDLRAKPPQDGAHKSNSVNAGLLATCFEQDIPKWVKNNKRFVAECHARAERSRAGSAVQTELAPPPETPDVYGVDLDQKRKGARA
jgi:hypothetical protein